MIRAMAVPAKLQRAPFLAPIGVAALLAMFGVLILAAATWLLITGQSTTIIVVRHAEKVLDAGADPPLTPQGQARAELLASLFGDPRLARPIDAIYVSPALRNRLTAAPLAARLGIVPTVAAQDDPRALARRMLREHAGGRILVVGHTDTVPAIVAALSGARDIPPIGDDEYGTLYIVTVPRIGRGSILSEHY
jgi:broad specificity phosphatase PhoE